MLAQPRATQHQGLHQHLHPTAGSRGVLTKKSMGDTVVGYGADFARWGRRKGGLMLAMVGS